MLLTQLLWLPVRPSVRLLEDPFVQRSVHLRVNQFIRGSVRPKVRPPVCPCVRFSPNQQNMSLSVFYDQLWCTKPMPMTISISIWIEIVHKISVWGILTCHHCTDKDVGDGTSGSSADVPGGRSWTGVSLILMGKNMEKKAIGIKNWKKTIN